MTLTATPNLQIPLMASNALQKEVMYNEAVLAIDTVFADVAIDIGTNTPPGSPNDGDVHIIGTAPTGAWAGKQNQITFYWNGWNFITPPARMQMYISSASGYYNWNGTAWNAGYLGFTNGPITGLTDVNIVDGSSIDGQTMMYDNSTSKWIAAKRVDLPVNALGSVSGSVTLDRHNGEYQTLTLSGNITALTINNWPATGKLGKLTLEITNGGTYTIAWPTGTKWPGGNVPTLTASGTDIIVLMSHDAGTTVRGSVAGQGYA
jgi:hypothetical protein